MKLSEPFYEVFRFLLTQYNNFFESTLLFFAATGNLTWSNRYHYVDILWQEDASCALSKTNTASVLQHDPIKAVCRNAHTRTSKTAIARVRMCKVTNISERTACTEKHRGTNTRQHRAQLSQWRTPQGEGMTFLSFDPPPLRVCESEKNFPSSFSQKELFPKCYPSWRIWSVLLFNFAIIWPLRVNDTATKETTAQHIWQLCCHMCEWECQVWYSTYFI